MLQSYSRKKKYKCGICLCILLLSLNLFTAASPLVSVGDNAEIYFNGSSAAYWSSNIFLTDDNEVDDTYFVLSPGIEVSLGRDVSDAELNIITRYDIIEYSELSNLDSELLHVTTRGAFKTSRLELTGLATYDEQKTNTGLDTRFLQFAQDDLIESELTNAEVSSEYRVSQKLKLGASANYNYRDYLASFDDVLADDEVVKIPLNIYYELTPKLDLSFGYTRENRNISSVNRVQFLSDSGEAFNTNRGAYDRKSEFFNIGARGALFPKLTGYFKVGYRTRDSSSALITNTLDGAFISSSTRNYGSTDTLGIDTDLRWIVTPKLTSRIVLSRDFDVGSDGAPAEESKFRLSSDLSLNRNWSANFDLSYFIRDYTSVDREENKYIAGLNLYYMPNRFFQFRSGYLFIDNNSKGVDARRSYESHMILLNATLRY